MIPPADWARLMVFKAVAETGTITGAAEALGVSHAKVSRDIEELERSLARELFRRSTRGMELTDVGQLVLRSVNNMADSAKAISHTVNEFGGNTRPQVSIATHDGLASYWLAPRLCEFYRANPGIEINIQVVQDTPDLSKGETDIAIQFDPPSQANIISRQLGWFHYMFFASSGYLDAHGAPKDRFDLGRHRMLHLTGYRKQQELWAAKVPAWQEIMPWILRTNFSTVLVECCAADGGIASMPTCMATVDKRLRPLSHLGTLASIRFWLTYTERVRDLDHCQPVLAWLRDCFDTAKHSCFREAFEPPKIEG